MRLRRVNGAGKRNATSASLNARPGLSPGRSQPNNTAQLIKASAPRPAATDRPSAEIGDKPARGPRRPEPPENGRRKMNQKYTAPTTAPNKYFGRRSRHHRWRSQLRKEVSLR